MRCCQAEEFRRKCVDDVSLEGKEIKNTIVITFAFQVVFTAFNALQNLHSSLHDEESLGNISMAILYGTAIVSSIFSPTVIGLIGAKSAIVASFAAHCIYVLANFYPSFSTMAPAAVALGAFHGPAWTSQALYISASAFSFSKSSSASPYTILSRFNGFFFAVFATAQILGNLVTSTIIRDGVSNSTEVIIKFCGPDDCPHSENATTIEDPEEWVIDITLGFLMACALLGLLLVIFLLTPLPRSDWIQRVSVRETATSCFQVLMSTNMVLLVPLIFFTAAEHAFLMSAYTKSYVACPIGIHMVGYVMAVYGVTTPAFVYIFSHLARITGRFLLLMLSLTTHIFLFIVLFKWSPTADDKAVIFIIPIVWGVSESILQAQANALIAMLFPTRKEPAFANFHAWRSLGYAITFLNASYMCVSTKIIICMTFAGLGTVLYIMVEFKAKIKQKLAFNRARPSIVSEVDMKQIRSHVTDAWKETSVTSLQSGLSRLAFDRVELADIIMEAQQGWRRDDQGLTLEINKVMSHEHLADSKVTNWYHTGPVICVYPDTPSSQTIGQTGLPRSLSDGQLLYAAAKVDAALHKLRRERIHNCSGIDKSRMVSGVTRRHVSDSAFRSFDIIPEVAYEDELTVQNETEINLDFLTNTNQVGHVFEHGDDDIESVIDEADTKAIMEYKKIIRRLSQTLARDGLILIGNDIDDCYQESLSSCGQENPAFDSEIGDLFYDFDDGDGVFTYGATSLSANGVDNKIFESDENNGPELGNKETIYSLQYNDSKLNRLNSNDHGYFSQSNEDTCSISCEINNSTLQKTAAETVSPKEEQKRHKSKILRVFRGLHKSKNKNKNEFGMTTKSSMDEKSRNTEGEEMKERSSSDADSNGFADDEFEDNKSYITADFTDTQRTRQKGVIPVSETEDVTCIY